MLGIGKRDRRFSAINRHFEEKTYGHADGQTYGQTDSQTEKAQNIITNQNLYLRISWHHDRQKDALTDGQTDR